MTRGQLVVVLCLLAIVIGVVPMILVKIRMQANNQQTTDNLKACALAVHWYHDTFRRLPDAYSTGGVYHNKPQSFWFHLLPYVQADAVHYEGTFDAVVPAFLAPTDPFNSVKAGTVNFAANIRVFGNETLTPDQVNKAGTAVSVPNGVIKSGLTLARIVDGTPGTIMLTSRYATCAGSMTWYAASPHGECNLGNFASPGVGGFTGAGQYTTPPSTERVELTAMFQLAPLEVDCVPQVALFGHSFDRVGLPTAMFDASVRNISPMMTPRTFASAMAPGDISFDDDNTWNDN